MFWDFVDSVWNAGNFHCLWIKGVGRYWGIKWFLLVCWDAWDIGQFYQAKMNNPADGNPVDIANRAERGS